MDPDTGDYRVIELIVPERLEAHLIVETIDEGTYIDPETGEPVEPQDPEIDPAKFEEYRDQIDEQDVTPDDFGRIAAQTAKQVILQRIREAERDMMFEEYRDRVGELITGIVQQSDSRYTLVQLRERVEALLPKSEQIDAERYEHSGRIKAVVKEVSASTKGPSIIVSRRDPELIKQLFELEVPEIADGLVEITDVQLSLAIGREGQNARLAARLTGWRVDIKSETEFAAEEAEHGYDEEEVSGRCAAIMSTGRRCPNASLPGSRYCGLDSHQALRRFDTDKVEVLSGLAEADVAALADADRSDEDVAEVVARATAAAPQAAAPEAAAPEAAAPEAPPEAAAPEAEEPTEAASADAAAPAEELPAE